MKASITNKAGLFLLAVLIHYSTDIQAQHMHNHTQKNIFVLMMDTMMTNMDNAPVGVSPAHDFIVQMIPHHEGAVAMALHEIQHGKDFTMRQLAKSILAEQTDEIRLMKLYSRQFSAREPFNQKDFKIRMDNTMEDMMNNMPANNRLNDVDTAFARVMIPHHQAAVDMAKVLLGFSANGQINAFAKQIISAQTIEIEQMTLFLNTKK